MTLKLSVFLIYKELPWSHKEFVGLSYIFVLILKQFGISGLILMKFGISLEELYYCLKRLKIFAKIQTV